MSKKWYVPVAVALAEARPPEEKKEAYMAWLTTMYGITNMFEREGVRFDRGRFTKACLKG